MQFVYSRFICVGNIFSNLPLWNYLIRNVVEVKQNEIIRKVVLGIFKDNYERQKSGKNKDEL